jgi:hypothetical protein
MYSAFQTVSLVAISCDRLGLRQYRCDSIAGLEVWSRAVRPGHDKNRARGSSFSLAALPS